MSLDKAYLGKLLTDSWGPDTSASPEEWSLTNPALGQCAVTALAVQDIYGGDLLRVMIDGASHYYNKLPEGKAIDYTFDQFGYGAAYTSLPEVRTREYILSFPDTRRRYATLLKRMWA